MQRKFGEPQNPNREFLFTDNTDELSHWLSAFVKETRKEDGCEYTPKILCTGCMLIAGLQQEICLHKQIQAIKDTHVFNNIQYLIKSLSVMLIFAICWQLNMYGGYCWRPIVSPCANISLCPFTILLHHISNTFTLVN